MKPNDGCDMKYAIVKNVHKCVCICRFDKSIYLNCSSVF